MSLKSMVKRTVGLILLAAFMFVPIKSAWAEIRVAATLPVLADIARQIGGPGVKVQALAKGTEDPHYVIPRPSLIAAVSRADLFVEMGLQFELWTERLLESAGNDSVRPGRIGHVYASDGVDVLEIPEHVTRAEGDIHPEGNPHAWLDPQNGVILARNIADGLKRVDPDHAADYERRFEVFAEAIKSRQEKWMKQAAPLRSLKIVTYHREWTYLARRFGLDVRATIEEKPGIPPSAAHRDRVLSRMKDDGVSLIALAPFEVNRISDRVAALSGARTVVLPTNVGGVPDATDYFSMFDAILNRLLAATQLRP